MAGRSATGFPMENNDVFEDPLVDKYKSINKIDILSNCLEWLRLLLFWITLVTSSKRLIGGVRWKQISTTDAANSFAIDQDQVSPWMFSSFIGRLILCENANLKSYTDTYEVPVWGASKQHREPTKFN